MQRADHLFRISLLYRANASADIMFGTFRAYYSIARQNVRRDSQRECREGEGYHRDGLHLRARRIRRIRHTSLDGFQPRSMTSYKMQPVNYGSYDKPRRKHSYLVV